MLLLTQATWEEGSDLTDNGLDGMASAWIGKTFGLLSMKTVMESYVREKGSVSSLQGLYADGAHLKFPGHTLMAQHLTDLIINSKLTQKSQE
ncbi:MAG: hypothetical protein HC904_15330 [Blastochloris sp.]|nr:hypothetical protein [Blastochloris sp.]